MDKASNRKSLYLKHLGGLSIMFVVNTESPITALTLKIGGHIELFDADEAFQLFDLLLRHMPAIERMKAGVPISIYKKRASQAQAEERASKS
jgi:hypothetical protein